ncbi:MAG: type IIL restriction-modification enzyme MmeI [Rhodospirillaceae bacterium]
MNIAEIESQLKTLVEKPFDPATFPFSLLEIYDAPKASVTKLRQGSANQAAKSGDLLRKDAQYDLLWKKKLFFRMASPGRAAETVDAMADAPLTRRHEPRFLLATDGTEVYCVDTKLDQSLETEFRSLNDRFDFFLPLAGIERYEAVAENPADIKATGRLAKLYDAILENDPAWVERTHELNLFMTRVLFCFFAEDTGIFEPGLFIHTVMSFTDDDGSGTVQLLTALFTAMDTPPDARGGMPDYVRRFPYVNGGLFADRTPVPEFNKRARRLLRDCGELKWQEINPDIFGSMIQAVVEPSMRGDMGMHYTSVPNIMKVLRPLFLLSLEDELAVAWDSETKLRKLLDRLYNIRVFDPACGSGNFLIIAYRELRRLENKVFARLNEVSREPKLPMTGIKLRHFYGIEWLFAVSRG